MIFRNSREVERSFMSRPNWQTPGRREWVHGRIHAADREAKGRHGKGNERVTPTMKTAILAAPKVTNDLVELSGLSRSQVFRIRRNATERAKMNLR